jgi:hypothetical protein
MSVPYGSAHWVLKKHLHLHPHKITSVHQLKERDVHHVEYCQWFIDVITANGEDILDGTFLTDEAWFHLSMYVNGQNSCICSATNSYEIKHTPLHDQKVGVWCVVPQNRIISPIFFSDTINMEHYCDVILYPFIGHLNATKLPAATSNKMVLLHIQLMFPWCYCVIYSVAR